MKRGGSRKRGGSGPLTPPSGHAYGSMAYNMWFGFQFNLSDSSDDDLYRLVLDPEGQGHQWKMIST